MSTEITDIIGKGWSFPPQLDRHGKISLVGGNADIEQAINIILMTRIGERVMRPTFGSRLPELSFAPNNTQTAAQASRFVEEALTMWEPRIRVNQVHAWPDPDEPEILLIQIDYTIKATYDKRSLIYPFYTIPEGD